MKKLTYLLTALYFAVLLGGCGSDNSAKDAGAPIDKGEWLIDIGEALPAF